MKRLCIFLVVLFTLTGCGTMESTAASVAADTYDPLAEMAVLGSDYEPTEIGVEWSEVDLLDDSYGWRLSDADFAELPLDLNSYACCRDIVDETENDNGQVAIRRMALDGTILREIWIDESTDPLADITSTCFVEDGLWLARRYKTVIDQETGQFAADFVLEHWSADGELLTSIPVNENLGVGEEGIMYLALVEVPDGIFLKHSFGMYLLDSAGTVLRSSVFEEDAYAFCYDSAGTLYFMTNNSTAICSIDWETLSAGEPIISVKYDEMVEPGSGPYEFLLRSSRCLKGVDLDNHTVTTILLWDDCGISDPTCAIYVDENTILTGVYSIFGGDTAYVCMKRVPVNEIPEKTSVHLAVAQEPVLREQGFRWQDCSGNLDEMISEFNLKNDYHIDVSVFSDAGELNLLMLGEDPPDMIWWGNLNMATTIRSYIRNGYLEDLTRWFASEDELSMDHFLPQIVEASTAADGGIYAFPVSVALDSMIGRQDLVGTKTGWSYEEFFAAVDALPDDIPIQTYTAESALLVYLRYNLGEFVHLDEGTTDFCGETFQRLLTLCKERFPVDVDDIQYFDDPWAAAYAGEVMTADAVFIGSAAAWASTLGEYTDAGMTVVGYPNVGGNGAVLRESLVCSLSAVGNQKEAAWQFLKQLYGEAYQGGFYGGDYTVRQDCLEPYARWEVKAYNLACTEEELQAALELYRNAVVADSVDDLLLDMVLEESRAYFDGTKTAMEVGELLDNRIRIYLSEQS